MFKVILAFLFLLSITSADAQKRSTISVIDFVRIKNEKRAEALYFYENNWKLYRDSALKRKFITSYRLLKTVADTTAGFDLMLITEYADSTQLNLSEARFQKIIKVLRPNGPILLNEVRPNDFRQILFTKEAETVLFPLKNKKRRAKTNSGSIE